MRSNRTFWQSILPALLATGMSTLTQSGKCDSLEHAQAPIEYRWRTNRCEGLYRTNAGAGDLELISLLVGRLTFDLAPGSQLEVVAPELGPLITGPIHVRALAIPARVYYRMDATLSESERLLWPIGDVLAPAQLFASRLGVFGWVETDSERVFVPLRVFERGREVLAPGQQIELRVRSSTALDHVSWRAYPEDATRSRLPTRQTAATRVDAWKPVTIILPSGGPGILRVDVDAKPQNSDRWQSVSVRVARPRLP
jgi:hypothetical protein